MIRQFTYSNIVIFIELVLDIANKKAAFAGGRIANHNELEHGFVDA